MYWTSSWGNKRETDLISTLLLLSCLIINHYVAVIYTECENSPITCKYIASTKSTSESEQQEGLLLMWMSMKILFLPPSKKKKKKAASGLYYYFIIVLSAWKNVMGLEHLILTCNVWSKDRV